jgi:hypothetical protein
MIIGSSHHPVSGKFVRGCGMVAIDEKIDFPSGERVRP